MSTSAEGHAVLQGSPEARAGVRAREPVRLTVQAHAARPRAAARAARRRPLAGLKLRADARLRARVLAARAQAVPCFLGAAPPLALTLDVTAPWGAGADDAKRRTTAMLGIKLRV